MGVPAALCADKEAGAQVEELGRKSVHPLKLTRTTGKLRMDYL